jgi:hypothetical protein
MNIRKRMGSSHEGSCWTKKSINGLNRPIMMIAPTNLRATRRKPIIIMMAATIRAPIHASSGIRNRSVFIGLFLLNNLHILVWQGFIEMSLSSSRHGYVQEDIFSEAGPFRSDAIP